MKKTLSDYFEHLCLALTSTVNFFSQFFKLLFFLVKDRTYDSRLWHLPL